MKAIFALVFVAMWALCQSHGGHPLTPCKKNDDCTAACPHAVGVCDVLKSQCHCHEYGHIPCDTDQECHGPCFNNSACCHNDHHCHCSEPCGQHDHSNGHH